MEPSDSSKKSGLQDDTLLAAALALRSAQQYQPSLLEQQLSSLAARRAALHATHLLPPNLLLDLLRQEVNNSLRSLISSNPFAAAYPSQSQVLQAAAVATFPTYTNTPLPASAPNTASLVSQLSRRLVQQQARQLQQYVVNNGVLMSTARLLDPIHGIPVHLRALLHNRLLTNPSQGSGPAQVVHLTHNIVPYGASQGERYLPPSRHRLLKQPRQQPPVCSQSQETDQDSQQQQAKATSDNAKAGTKRRRYRTEPFPVKLRQMIEHAKKQGLEHVISFTKDGTAVQASSHSELEEHLFPKYFRHQNYSSFKRQLSMYGFVRITAGRNKGAFEHPLFVESRPDLAEHIQRVSVIEQAQRRPKLDK